jgi:hypothetical protein
MKKKLLISSCLLVAALGVYKMIPNAESPNLTTEQIKVTFQSDSFNNINSFPLLNGYNTWSIHNDQHLSFLTNDLTGNYEILLSTEARPEIYYQIIYHHNDNSIKFFKWIGGEWSTDRIVSRTHLMRVLWDVSEIRVDLSKNKFKIDIPWSVIPEISSNRNGVLMQIISGAGNDKQWSSSNERHPTVEGQFDTHLHDRNKWQRIEFR